MTFGQSQTLTATTDSDLPVTYASGSTDVCMVSGPTVTTIKTGTCTITASQPGDNNYFPAPPRTQQFDVTPAPQTIDFPRPPDMAYGQSQTLTATTDSDLPVTYASGSTDVCTVSGPTVTTIKTGTCTITASQPGDTNHYPAQSATQQFNIGRASQTIDFPQPKSATVGQPLTLTAKASSGLPVTYTSGSPDACTVSGPTVSPIKAQQCSITASQPGDGNYAPAKSITLWFPTERGPQTISFPAVTGVAVRKAVALGAKASSGLPVTYTSDTPDVCTVSGTTATATRGSTCKIIASQPGDENYLQAKPVSQSFPVQKISQTISFTPPKSAEVDQRVALSASATSQLDVLFTSDSPDVCTVSGTTVTTLKADTCKIAASQPGNDQFAPAHLVTGSFPVAEDRADHLLHAA